MHLLKSDSLPNQIHYETTEYGPIYIYENKDYIWLTFSNGLNHTANTQGLMNKAEPEKICTPVKQSMFLFLLTQTKDLQILNIGLGSAGVERTLEYFQHNSDYLFCTISQFDTVEINAGIINAAKQFFKLPPTHTVYEQCAEKFIAECTNLYNIIHIDMFNGDHHPKFIENHPFWIDLTNSLATNGQVLININPNSGDDLKLFLTLMREYFACIALIEFNDYQNIVLILSNCSLKYITVEAIHASNVMRTMAPNLHNDIKAIYHME
jgi:spermidine synthase